MKTLVTVAAAVLITAFSAILVHMRVLVSHETEMRDCRADVAECENKCRDSLRQEQLIAIRMRLDEIEGGPGADSKSALAIEQLRDTVEKISKGMGQKPEPKP